MLTGLLIQLLSFGICQANSPSERVIQSAHHLLKNFSVSYKMGGSRVLSVADCDQCTQCLLRSDLQGPNHCPPCEACTLDCSHFTQLVFKMANLKMPYLDTHYMLNLNARKLKYSYYLLDLGKNFERSQPADLLVYRGHVVLLIARVSPTHGTIIHVTSGKSLKGPGMAIQKMTNVNLTNFKGRPLQRILRHKALVRPHRAKNPFRPIGSR